MKAINVGDVYFLSSIFKGNMDKEVEKKVSFLLGTISPRPVVVIREPFPWDKYGEVTVLPSISHSNTALAFQSINRLGGYSDHDYSFLPHAPSRIPVTRLGRYIGRLSEDELDELLYAFQWIHSPKMMAEGNREEYPIPKVYTTVFAEMEKYRNNPAAIAKDTFYITDDLMLKSFNGDAPVDLKLNLDKASIQNSVPAATAKGKDNLNAVKTILDKKEQPKSEPESKPVVIVTAPAASTITQVKAAYSMLPGKLVEKYMETCGIKKDRLDIIEKVPPRKTSVITPDEVEVLRGELSLYDFQLILDEYRNLTALDRDYFMIWIPTTTLVEALNRDQKQIAILKRVCDFMNGMPEEDYIKREKKTSHRTIENPDEEREMFNRKYPMFTAEADIQTGIKVITPWLTQDRIGKMPKTKQQYFVRIPMTDVSAAAGFPNFRYYYYSAYAGYRRKLINDLKEKGK